MYRVIMAGLLCFASGGAMAATVTCTGTMNGATEVPPKTTDGKGTANATLDTSSKMLTYDVEYTGLTGPATVAHFHGPAAPGANAPVVKPFASAASPIKGEMTLTDGQMADLQAGKWYANVHTAANPGGEIRGQMDCK